jgi:hypothetical protein
MSSSPNTGVAVMQNSTGSTPLEIPKHACRVKYISGPPNLNNMAQSALAFYFPAKKVLFLLLVSRVATDYFIKKDLAAWQRQHFHVATYVQCGRMVSPCQMQLYSIPIYQYQKTPVDGWPAYDEWLGSTFTTTNSDERVGYIMTEHPR